TDDDRPDAGEAAVFRFDDSLKVFLHRQPVDFRLGINGLSILVEQAMSLNPMAQALYVFGNRRRDRIKILGWDGNGFWMLLKRLEADRFIWPDTSDIVKLSVEQLHWLLDGIDIAVVKKHPQRFYARAS
ncbi:IS66 family insertion sequence element accessory protein TnpB, partial [Ralstonia solanacearum]|uniref:IS66 family insertion sequence element accessory protein TnpB n=2 Tax=Ralstonia solanacearum TaxID=305 RepID=UPI002F94C8AE